MWVPAQKYVLFNQNILSRVQVQVHTQVLFHLHLVHNKRVLFNPRLLSQVQLKEHVRVLFHQNLV